MRKHRRVLIAGLMALVLEPVSLFMLAKGAPIAGVPRDPRLWLRIGGDIAALLHAPAILLNGLMCRRFQVPVFILWADSFVAGYLAIALLLLLSAWLWRTLFPLPMQ